MFSMMNIPNSDFYDDTLHPETLHEFPDVFIIVITLYFREN